MLKRLFRNGISTISLSRFSRPSSFQRKNWQLLPQTQRLLCSSQVSRDFTVWQSDEEAKNRLVACFIKVLGVTYCVDFGTRISYKWILLVRYDSYYNLEAVINQKLFACMCMISNWQRISDWEGDTYHKGSICASHPAAKGSTLSVEINFFSWTLAWVREYPWRFINSTKFLHIGQCKA